MGERREITALLEDAKEGHEWALTALYHELQPGLLGFLYGLAPGEAEDLAAETWIDAARLLADFEGSGDDFRGLLFTIARRRAIDHGRKRRRRRTEPTDFDELVAFVDRAPDVGEVVAELDTSRRAVRRIFALLPKAQAEVVVLRVVGGLSVPEVAEIVGRTPSAVSVLQTRGLRRLATRTGNRPRWEREPDPR